MYASGEKRIFLLVVQYCTTVSYKLNPSALKEIGLTEGEARAYCSLVEKQGASAPEVSRLLGTQKSAAYFCLERLVAKGLASQLLVGKVRRFYPAPVQNVVEKIGEKTASLEKTRVDLLEFAKTFVPGKSSVSARLFQGWKGMESAFQDLLGEAEKNQEYLIFSINVPEPMFPRFRRFIKRLHKQRIEMKIPSRVLVSKELRKTLGMDREKEPFIKVKYLPSELAAPSVINVYRDKTLIAIWSEEPNGLLIESKTTADSFKNYFQLLWNSKF